MPSCATSSAPNPANASPHVPIEQVGLPEPALSGSARDALAAVLGPGGLSQEHAARVGHAAGRSYPDLVRLRSGTGLARSRRGAHASLRGAGASDPRDLRPRAHRRGAVRRRDERRRRRGAAARGPRGRGVARPGRARQGRRGGPEVAHRHPRGRPVRAGGRGAARRAGPHARALPAVVRVLHGGRLGGHALGRAGVHRLWAHRRAGGGRDARGPGGRPDHARRPGHGRRPAAA